MYRDPNYLNTLSVFENCVQWIKKGEYTDEDLDECKLSVFSQVCRVQYLGINGAYIKEKLVSGSSFL